MKFSDLVLMLLLCCTPLHGQTLSFAIVPQQSAKKMAAHWTPIIQYLQQRSGLNISFTTAKDIPTFESRLRQGEYDLAYMNPYHFVVFHQTPGYQALVRQRDKRIVGIIVVPVTSQLDSLAALQDAQVAFPAPAAFAASILPRAELQRAEVEVTPRYVSSHDSVYLSVAKGLFPAGGGVLRTFNNTAEEVRAQLKVVWQTQPYTPHAVAVHPRLDGNLVAKLQQAFLDMNDDKVANRLLSAINFKGFEAASSADWDDVRALNIASLSRPVE